MTKSGTQTALRARVPLIVAVVAMALLLHLSGPPAAQAAEPANKIYLMFFTGLGGPTEFGVDCLKFFADGTLCSLGEDAACGTWTPTTQAQGKTTRLGFDYTVAFTEEGVTVTIDGSARLDSRGKGSSIGGAARLTLVEAASGEMTAQRTSISNHGMSGHSMKKRACLRQAAEIQKLLEEG